MTIGNTRTSVSAPEAVRQRLAQTLLQLATQYDVSASASGKITDEHLASLIDYEPQIVTEILKELERVGLIESNPQYPVNSSTHSVD